MTKRHTSFEAYRSLRPAIESGYKEMMIVAKKEERFEVVFKDGSAMLDAGVRQILVDKDTGVHYLIWKSGYGAGITPLLDSNGKPIIKRITDTFRSS